MNGFKPVKDMRTNKPAEKWVLGNLEEIYWLFKYKNSTQKIQFLKIC
jgi:hypothetical protein